MFTRIMWAIAAIMICVVFVALASTGSHAHSGAKASRRPAGAVAGGR